LLCKPKEIGYFQSLNGEWKTKEFNDIDLFLPVSPDEVVKEKDELRG
jgi:hypothetical protein